MHNSRYPMHNQREKAEAPNWSFSQNVVFFIFNGMANTHLICFGNAQFANNLTKQMVLAETYF
jgi:hypothetical protein